MYSVDDEMNTKEILSNIVFFTLIYSNGKLACIVVLIPFCLVSLLLLHIGFFLVLYAFFSVFF